VNHPKPAVYKPDAFKSAPKSKFALTPARLMLFALVLLGLQFAAASSPAPAPAQTASAPDQTPAPQAAPQSPASPSSLAFDRYHTPAELNAALLDMARANPAFARTHSLAKSSGGRELILLEIGPETAKTAIPANPALPSNPASPATPSQPSKTFPAVFIAADMEGTVPISGEAALYLARLIIAAPALRADRTWYILPCGNPDAASLFFAKPLRLDPRNARPHNDDMDDQIDEDGPEDLNGDGLITQMRVKDPEGEWMSVPGQPRLLKRADWSKGEKGVYKLYSEGIDNDGDGKYNEDGPGGTNVGTNFPHLFKFFAPDSGAWPGSEAESFALFKFFDAHREIGLTFVFGESNFCLNPPRGGRRSESDLSQIKIPERIASAFGADPARTYTMAEIMEMVKPMAPPGMEITESMIAGFLGLGAVVNPLDDDLKFYKELSEKFKEFLKTNKLDAKRLDPPPDKDGSFELWSYYQLGLPSFALDFWTLPEVKEEKKAEALTADQLEKMTKDEFLALGEEKIDAFLKAAGAPAQFKAKQVIDMVKAGQLDPKKMADMMKQMPKPPSEEGIDPKDKALLAFSDKELAGKGFVDWKPFKHPTLGEVEIGGAVPYADNTPPPAMIEPLLKGQVPWVFEVAKKMARVRIASAEIKPVGTGVYEIKVRIENTGALPYPTAMARRNERILPVIVTLEGPGIKIVDGKKRTLIPAIQGLATQTATWIVQSDKPVKIEVKAETQTAWRDTRVIELGGVK